MGESFAEKKPRWRDNKRNAKCNFMTTMRRFAEVRVYCSFFYGKCAHIIYCTTEIIQLHRYQSIGQLPFKVRQLVDICGILVIFLLTPLLLLCVLRVVLWRQSMQAVHETTFEGYRSATRHP